MKRKKSRRKIKRKKPRRVKKIKSPVIAAFLNTILWGSGYIYLNKKKTHGIFELITYILLWLFSVWYVFNAGQLVFAGVFWIFFWSIWISIFLAYDAYKLGRNKNELY